MIVALLRAKLVLILLLILHIVHATVYKTPTPRCNHSTRTFNARVATFQLTMLCRALAGFLLSLTPLSCDLMGWRGAGGNGAASTGVYFFFGGLLMILGSLGEVGPANLHLTCKRANIRIQWVLGNTFPFVVFGTFGAFWLTYAATLQPFYNSYGAYKDPTVASSTGLETPGFNASFGKTISQLHPSLGPS